MAPPPPWSDLPEELLQLIFECLTTDCLDLLRCRGVCVSWRTLVIQVYRKLKPLIHPLLLLIRSDGANEEGGCYVFNPKTNQVHRILSSETRGRWCHSSSYGWILTIGHDFPHEIHLLNPFTRAQIRLPPAGSDFKWPQWLKVVTSTSPTNPNCIVLLTHSLNEIKLAFCKPGDQRWSTRSCPVPYDSIFYKGQFYMVGLNGYMVQCKDESYRFQTPPCWQLDQHKCSLHNYLVESTSGDLFFVTRYKRHDLRLPEAFEVYKLDWSKKEWSVVTNLGDQTIFLSNRSSISISAGPGLSISGQSRCLGLPLRSNPYSLILPRALKFDMNMHRRPHLRSSLRAPKNSGLTLISASHSGECRANCIYFVEDIEKAYTSKDARSIIGVYDMGTESIEWLYQSSPIWDTTLNWMIPDI